MMMMVISPPYPHCQTLERQRSQLRRPRYSPFRAFRGPRAFAPVFQSCVCVPEYFLFFAHKFANTLMIARTLTR